MGFLTFDLPLGFLSFSWVVCFLAVSVSSVSEGFVDILDTSCFYVTNIFLLLSLAFSSCFRDGNPSLAGLEDR